MASNNKKCEVNKDTRVTVSRVEQYVMVYFVIIRYFSLFIAYFPFDALKQRGSHVIQTPATMEESVFPLPMDLFADVPQDIEEKHAQVCAWF